VDRALLAVGVIALVALAAALLATRRRGAPGRVEPAALGLHPGGRGIAVVGFSTPYCLPCQAWEAALESSGIDFLKVDLAARPELARRYRIRSTPLVLAVRLPDGEVVAAYHDEPHDHEVKTLRDLATAAA
jgi:hypothetical protein